MDMIERGYRGLGLVCELNMDRVINLVTISIALLTSAYIGSLL
ncbi:MAG: hypothetical protein AAGB28_17010 [Pseudomonadota bacterium]